MKTILLIDDEPSVLQVMGYVLQADTTFVVLKAASAEEAFARVAESNGNIDLIISDVTLEPNTAGVAVPLHVLKTLNPNTKVILSSGNPPEMWSERHSVLIQQLPSDSVRFLEKPFSPLSLLLKVDELIGPPVKAHAPFTGTAIL